MKKNPAATTWRKIKYGAAGVAVAAISLFGGAAAMDSAVADDVAPVEEQAGGTWSFMDTEDGKGGKGGPGPQAARGTWS